MGTVSPRGGGRVLVAEEDPVVRGVLGRILRDLGARCEVAATGDEAVRAVERGHIDLVVVDVAMTREGGANVLEAVRAHDPALPVIATASQAEAQSVIEASRLGAFDLLRKPFHVDEASQMLQGALGARHRSQFPRPPRPQGLDGTESDHARLIGSSPASTELLLQIGRAARSDAPVLVRGEVGTGKKLVSRAIHTNSGRRDGPFLTVNCAALPEDRLLVELFGTEETSPDATQQIRQGLVDRGQGGTLVLENVDRLPSLVQPRLMTLLQEGTFHRVNGLYSIPANVRIVATALADLGVLAAEGRYLASVSYLLNVLTIAAPPLRERLGDIPELAAHFLRKHRRLSSQMVEGIEPAALAMLQRHHWPGNVIELESLVTKAMMLCRSKVLTTAEFPTLGAAESQARPRGLNGSGAARPTSADDLLRETAAPPPAPRSIEGAVEQLDSSVESLVALMLQDRESRGHLYNLIVGRAEERLLTAVYEKMDHNQSLTAKELGISRNNLRAKLKDYGDL